MARKKICYSIGDCFLIPLRNNCYARGVVARMDGKGSVFGYFFGPSIVNKEDVIVDNSLHPDKAVMSGFFGDLGLIKGEWLVVGKISGWSNSEWLLPPLLRWEEGDTFGFLSIYDEDSLKCISVKKISTTDIDHSNYPEDGSMGYGFVEIKLTKLLTTG